MNDSVGGAFIVVHEWNSVDKDLAGLGCNTHDFAVEGSKCGSILEDSAELKSGDNVVGQNSFEKNVVRKNCPGRVFWKTVDRILGWYEDSVQVTVQDFDKTARLQEPVEVAVLRLNGLGQQAFGERVEYSVHDVENDVLESCISLEDVSTRNGDRPAIVIDLDEDIVSTKGGDLEVALQ